MNIKNLDRLICALKASRDDKFTHMGFNMSYLCPDETHFDYYEPAVCICGFAYMVAKNILNEKACDFDKWDDLEVHYRPPYKDNYHKFFSEFLDISAETAAEVIGYDLFYETRDATIEQAIAVLENFKLTGKVDWK